MKSINKKDISNYIYVLIMILVFLLSYKVNAQSFLKNDISVVEFNTSWNEDNHLKNLDKLNNCKYYTIILCDHIEYMDKYNIKQPTIIVFNNGNEIIRFKSTIMLDFDITYKDLQKEVDVLLLNKFN
tara:strand:+ start:21522 stop:21902 length:381 start_codon:yes stop_codon:yes gene_type:complete